MQLGSNGSVSVVIPFFQREEGILSRALASVFAQNFDKIDIIVVDDASPLQPDADISHFPDRDRAKIRVISQANQGPGGARNTGLDAVPPHSRFVAFLDSDDIWQPEHLANALCLLADEKIEFFFANYSSLGDTRTRLGTVGLADQGAPIGGRPDHLRLFQGDLFLCILKSWPIHASTVVFDREMLGGLRFDTRLRSAGEDQLFWLDCANRAPRVGFSLALGARLGQGANIARKDFPGSEGYSRRCLYQFMMHTMLPDRFVLSDAAAKANRDILRGNRREFITSELVSLMKTGRLNLTVSRDWVKLDPLVLRALPSAALGLLGHAVKKTRATR